MLENYVKCKYVVELLRVFKEILDKFAINLVLYK